MYKSVFYVVNTSASGSPNVVGAFASTGILLWAAASKEPPILLAATAEASPAASPCSLAIFFFFFLVFEPPYVFERVKGRRRPRRPKFSALVDRV